MNLTWQDNSGNETGFVIERKTGTGSYAVPHHRRRGSITYSDLAAVAGTQYTYRVAATSTAGNSAYSNEATVTTPTSGGGQTPYGGAPWAVGATVQAEDFDNGGEGVAFTNRSGNRAGRTGSPRGWTSRGQRTPAAATTSATWRRRVAGVHDQRAHRGRLQPGPARGLGEAGGTFHVEFAGVDKTGQVHPQHRRNRRTGRRSASRCVTAGNK